MHRICRQHDGLSIWAETDLGRGRDHDFVSDSGREVRQQEGGCAGADRHVTQNVPAGATLDDHLIAGDDAVERVVRRRIPFQVHRTGVVSGRFDVLWRFGRAWRTKEKSRALGNGFVGY